MFLALLVIILVYSIVIVALIELLYFYVDEKYRQLVSFLVVTFIVTINVYIGYYFNQ